MSWLNALRRQFLPERRRNRFDRRCANHGCAGAEQRTRVRRAFDRENLKPIGPEEGDQPRGRIDWDPMAKHRRGH